MGAADVSAAVKPAGGPAAWADVATVDHGTAVVFEKLQPVIAGALARVPRDRAPWGR